MKRIKEEIAQNMTSLMSSNGTITSRFLFPESFLGFQGHFPDKKILPGVCQVQCVLTALERATKSSIRLREIVLAKYFAPVVPNDEVACVCSDVGQGEFIMKAVMTKGDQKVSEFKLRVVVEGRAT